MENFLPENLTLKPDLLKESVFKDGDADWVDELSKRIQKFFPTFPCSTKLKEIRASIKFNESEIYNNRKNKRKKVEPSYRTGDLVKTV